MLHICNVNLTTALNSVPEQRRSELFDGMEDVASEEIVVVEAVPLQVPLSHQRFLRDPFQGVEVSVPWTYNCVW